MEKQFLKSFCIRMILLLVAVIGVVDLTRVTNRISSVTYEPLSPILAAGLLYVAIIGCLLKLQGIAERKARRLAR